MGSRGAGSGRNAGGGLNNYEATTNAILNDITREMARSYGTFSVYKQGQMAKQIDKNTDVGDRLALIDTKTGKPDYQAEKVSKGNWKIIDKNGKEIMNTETEGALRFIKGVDQANTSDYEKKKRSSLTYPKIYHKKK